jgi:transcriptional regulator with XRE-family HTH domain
MRECDLRDAIVNRRLELGLTVERCAHRMFIAPQTLEGWEDGHALTRIAAFLTALEAIGIELRVRPLAKCWEKNLTADPR